MNRIEITLERIEFPDWIEEYRTFVSRVLDYLNIDNWEISVLLCDGEMIRRLNKSYRNKNEVTDVLSFPQGDGETAPGGEGPVPAGDIVIALDRITEQAAEYGVEFVEELYRMSIHGILHLAGHHHSGTSESEPMLQLQEKILTHLMGEEKS
ncbi:rRNA maturation RNase YbeY [Marispirochaeta sp.]|jgi:probable rRNA maturation factor|uniref:rRNA maturation RNase YbeY n=1 Tax=Marispirochaeta sp. TaxID=2038653 RepID=UPI0029C7F58F|nr:rRNA maturation RNase YbeY [Marispirochaeta sp.]